MSIDLPMVIEAQVTQEHIDRGAAGSPRYCPVGQAVMARLIELGFQPDDAPFDGGISVEPQVYADRTHVDCYGDTVTPHVVYENDIRTHSFVESFDAGRRPWLSPFTARMTR